ncbi:MAG: heme ABC exporter ATP-binding protein CcmA [Pseudomonadota bacterium]|nr:heme ABC exporter ATP-binding protein CcmA [Pseudomonadota bacterium]
MSIQQPSVSKLIVSNLSTSRGGKMIFDKLSFSLAPGEILLVKGENGSGKSTLLSNLANILPPTSGKICLKTRETQKVRYIGHKLAIKTTLTVRQNLSFWCKLYNANNKFFEKSVKDFSLSHFLDFQINKLSAGLIKRVSLARLLIGESLLWILDEPYINMDKKNIELLNKIIEINLNKGIMVVIASHQPIQIDSHKSLDLAFSPPYLSNSQED